MPRNTDDKPIDTPTIGRTAHQHLSETYPGWSIDKLLTHPAQAMEICRKTRASLSRKLQDDQVLEALLNARKRGLIRSK